jgi:hypothetical protein
MRRRGDRIRGRRGYGGVVLVPCLLHDAYRYWLLADTGAARTLITPDVAFELDLDVQTPVRQERIASVHRVVAAPGRTPRQRADRRTASHPCRSPRAATPCGTAGGWLTGGQCPGTFSDDL